MKLKNRILLIPLFALTLTAGVIGSMLVYLFLTQDMRGFDVLGILGFVIGILILVMINILLNKAVIIPAVEREMLENERVMLTEQLLQAQKLEAVGRLAGSIAHDFNNLLTIIDGYTSLIIANPQSGETAQHAKEVLDAARRASFITKKLLSFSHKEKSVPVLLDLNHAMEDSHKMLSRLIGEKVKLVMQSSKEPIHVMGDPIQLGQVLMNLCVNARDAMPNGGRITIETGREEVPESMEAKPVDLPAGPFAKISVRDTGQGIEPETLKHIFEPFFTTKEAGKGTGLGLSIVKNIIKQCDGFIDVKSKPGSGTTFVIYLPLAIPADVPAAAPAPDPAAAARPAVPGPRASESLIQSETILLVEDDPLIRNLVFHSLESLNYKVIAANDGWEALTEVRKYGGPIDLLLTDVVMPGLGGGELAKEMKDIYPNIKVLFISGYSREQVTEEGVPPGAALLEKPFTPGKLSQTVRLLLDAE